MKTPLKTFVFRLFYKLGFFPPKRLGTPKQFSKTIALNTRAEKVVELKRRVALVSMMKDHTYYNCLLREFIPQWAPPLTETQFLGIGLGQSNLNAHRRVVMEGEVFFEKVYFNTYKDLQTTMWIQEQIRNKISKEIRIPKLRKRYSGELLTVVYEEYMELQPLSDSTEEDTLVDFSKSLYRLSRENFFDFKYVDISDYKEVFRIILGYAENREKIKTRLAEKQLDIEYFEDKLRHAKHILTHGDLNRGNAFENRVLIDWDNAGAYPIGYDPAHIYYSLWIENRMTEEFPDWLNKHYGNAIREEDWEDFERNACYFLYIFFVVRYKS